MKYDIFTAGFPMAEVMRTKKGVDFSEAAGFIGPYPSGDTCIVADVAAKLGMKCCLAATAGKDAFGELVIGRLKRDGVDVSGVRIIENLHTAVVFVRYEADGTREYIDFTKNSASSQLASEDIYEDAVKNSRWIHFSGEVLCGCAKGSGREAIHKLFHLIPEKAGVCFDPNMTGEIKNISEMIRPLIDRADLILPSEREAACLMGTETDEEACRLLAGKGKIVALKRGKAGCDIYSGSNKLHIQPYNVKEIDATGCGDSFCAGFMTGLIKGWPLELAGKLACAAGALQAAALGPMEGVKNLEEILNLMKKEENDGN